VVGGFFFWNLAWVPMSGRIAAVYSCR
jgi:hypothetical protein